MKKIPWITMAILSCHSLLFGAEIKSAPYRIANRIQVGGEGGWDLLAVDESTGRLFLSHGMAVEVVDTRAGKVIGTIPDTKGVHGIALAPDLNKGFITCGRDSTVAIFSLDSLKVITRLGVGARNPDAIAYEPATQRVFAFNGGSANATVIDAKTNTVVGMVALGGKPELPAVDGKGRVFVNLEDSSMVVVIDASTLKVTSRWSIAPGEEPTGLAIDPATRRLFIGCHNQLMVIMDAEVGKVIGQLPIGDRVDGVGFDPGLKRAYSSNGDGTLTVVEEVTPDSFRVVENVVTQKGARTLAVDTKTHHLFLPTAEYGATPAPTTDNPRPRPAVVPGSFVVLDVAP